MTLRALLVDDEALARTVLRRLLLPHQDHIEIVGEASHGREAIELTRQLGPDVLFLDVEMPGLDGFAVVHELTVQPLVVFTTAFREYALAAFKENAVGYLVKPIGQDDVDVVVKKLRSLTSRHSTRPQADDANDPEPVRLLRHLLVPGRDSIKPVPVGHIVYLETEDKLTHVATETVSFDIDTSLSELEAKLPAHFVRINRGCLVNTKYISELRRWDARRLQVVLSVPLTRELVISRRCVESVKRRLELGV